MKRNGIVINGRRVVSPISVSTVGGHWGLGLLPLAFHPEMAASMMLLRMTNTTEILKSSTLKNHIGNFIFYNPKTWRYVQKVGQYDLLNAYSHTNWGAWLNFLMAGLVKKLGFDIIPSFAADYSQESQNVIAENVYAADIAVKNGFNVIEYVPSCPNRSHCIVDNIAIVAESIRQIKKKNPKLIISIKKGIQHPTEAAQEWEKAGMDILHGINAISFNTVFPGIISPLQDVGGGAMSGPEIYSFSLKDNIATRKAISTFMIFGGGISKVTQAEECFDCGASSVIMCTSLRRDGEEARHTIRTVNT